MDSRERLATAFDSRKSTHLQQLVEPDSNTTSSCKLVRSNNLFVRAMVGLLVPTCTNGQVLGWCVVDVEYVFREAGEDVLLLVFRVEDDLDGWRGSETVTRGVGRAYRAWGMSSDLELDGNLGEVGYIVRCWV